MEKRMQGKKRKRSNKKIRQDGNSGKGYTHIDAHHHTTGGTHTTGGVDFFHSHRRTPRYLKCKKKMVSAT